MLTREAENSENTSFSHEIKSAPFLSLTHSHPQLGCGWKSRAQWSESWDRFQLCHGGLLRAQTDFFLSLPPAPVCSTDTAINIPTGGLRRGTAHNRKALCSSNINTPSPVGTRQEGGQVLVRKLLAHPGLPPPEEGASEAAWAPSTGICTSQTLLLLPARSTR